MSSSLDLGGEGTFLSHAILIKTFVDTGVSVFVLTQKPGVGEREMDICNSSNGSFLEDGRVYAR